MQEADLRLIVHAVLTRSGGDRAERG